MYVKIFATGGTIDKDYFDAKSNYQVGQPKIATVLKALNLGFEYLVQSLMRKDSLDLTAADRERIRRAVSEDSAARIIITHGTDTMVATAAELSAVKNKTIVLTGALEPALFKTSDAVFNIGCAVAAVQTLDPGVYIAMNGRIFAYDRVRKNVKKSRFEETVVAGKKSELTLHPLTPSRWLDFEGLFGSNGANGGCWCMWWRLTRAEFDRQKGEGNRKAMKAIVASGEVPGILAYAGGNAVGWCSVAPREVFASLNRSPVLKRLDDREVWSIVCFFIHRSYRGRGATAALIDGAIDYVKQKGGRIVEAYPTNPRGPKRLGGDAAFMGLPKLFMAKGFKVCARPSAAKVIMRYNIIDNPWMKNGAI